MLYPSFEGAQDSKGFQSFSRTCHSWSATSSLHTTTAGRHNSTNNRGQLIRSDDDDTEMCGQADPGVLFEATLAEGVPFKVKASVTDDSDVPEGELLELEFR